MHNYSTLKTFNVLNLSFGYNNNNPPINPHKLKNIHNLLGFENGLLNKYITISKKIIAIGILYCKYLFTIKLYAINIFKTIDNITDILAKGQLTLLT